MIMSCLDEIFSNISLCTDKELLYESLDYVGLKIIDDILFAHFNNDIDIIEPRFNNGEPDFCGEFELVINDKKYRENGFEMLILKWVNDYESVDYLIDCISTEI